MGSSESSEIGAGTADPALGVGRSASVRAIGRSISPPIGSISVARAPPMGAGKSISVPEAADMGAGRSVPPGPSSGAGRSMSANGSKPDGSAWAFGAGRSATPGSSNGSKSRERPPFFGAGRSAKSPPLNGAGRSTSPVGAGKSEGGDLIAAAGAAGGLRTEPDLCRFTPRALICRWRSSTPALRGRAIAMNLKAFAALWAPHSKPVLGQTALVHVVRRIT
jgi:hypothetical protein